uniref:Putative ovule protein n=1 Tax=Solanum chacoense TaxID=4108 RepID=A0A0V0HLP3_SOLCH
MSFPFTSTYSLVRFSLLSHCLHPLPFVTYQLVLFSLPSATKECVCMFLYALMLNFSVYRTLLTHENTDDEEDSLLTILCGKLSIVI